MAQAPVYYSAVTALTGSTQTIVMFTAGTGNANVELTDLTLEASAVGPFQVAIQVGGTTVDTFQVSNAAGGAVQIDNFGTRPTASNGATIALLLPSGAGNITANATAVTGP